MQACNLSGFASPFISLWTAVRTLDTTRVPLAFSWVNLVCASMWSAYGFMLGDPWIFGPNVVGASIAAIQLLGLAYIRVQLWRGRKPAGQLPAGVHADSAGIDNDGATSIKAIDAEVNCGAFAGTSGILPEVGSTSSLSTALSSSSSSNTAEPEHDVALMETVVPADDGAAVVTAAVALANEQV